MSTPAEYLAAALSDDPPAALPATLPCAPLELLIALHAQVTDAMGDDFGRAGRAAAAATRVAAQFPDDPLLAAQAHWSQGSAVLFVPDYARALAHYDAALAAYARAEQAAAPHPPARDVRVVQIVRLLCLSELGRYAEAREAERTARAWLAQFPDDRRMLSLITNSSGLAGDSGDYTRMIALTDEARALATKLNDPEEVAYAWINRAYACTFLGRFDEAEQALEHGIAAAEAAGDWLTTARGICNRAVLRRCQGQFFAALGDLHAARLGMARAAGEAATVALEEAALYAQLQQLHEAQRAALRAAEQFAAQAMPAYSARAALYGVRLAVQQGQLSTAHRLLTLAREQTQRVDLVVLDAEVALGEALLVVAQAKRPTLRATRAEIGQAYQLAVAAVAQLTAHGLAEETAEGELIVATLETLRGKHKAALRRYEQLAQHPSRDVQIRAVAELAALLPPTAALPWWQKAAALSVAARRMLSMEELQATYSSATLHYHLRLAACHVALGQVDQALASIWEAKAGPLLDLRTSAAQIDDGARTALEVDKATIARLRAIEDEQRRRALRAVDDGQDEHAAFSTQRADAAAIERAAHERRAADTLRLQGGREGQAALPSLADVQAQLRPDTVLLEFGCWDDSLVGVLVRCDQPPQLRVLGSYQEAVLLLDRWSLVRQQLMDRPLSQAESHIQRALASLAALVLVPWEAHLATLSHLIVAPWGVLYHLPWATLPYGDGWLSDQVTITLTPSGALWAAGARDLSLPSSRVGPARLLGYASTGERRLPNVAAELAAIERHLPDAQCTLDAMGADLRAAPPPRLLHIAAHGQTNIDIPLCSTIELADGEVSLLEMHRLDLRGTELVVLSACETSARPNRGDMALALAGAFLCAGADAVLASLWPVDDAATAQLMERFYAALTSGITAAAALQVAQRQLRTSAPLDWAAFQLLAGAPPRAIDHDEGSQPALDATTPFTEHRTP